MCAGRKIKVTILSLIIIGGMLVHVLIIMSAPHLTLKTNRHGDSAGRWDAGCVSIMNDTFIPASPNYNESDISFIIGTRNDGYGGNPLQRLRFTVQQLLLYPWYKKHNIIIEVIIVEWNTFDGYINVYNTKWIETLINHLVKSSNLSIDKIFATSWIKFISVNEEHSQTANLKGFDCSFFDMWAKNVGMRRASGKWIMAMNIDDIWSVPLLNYMANKIQYNKLDINGFYTAKPRRDRLGERLLFDREYPQYFAVEYLQSIPLYDCHIIVNDSDIFKRDDVCNFTRSEDGPGWVGDFQLFHRSVLTEYFGGGMLEIPLSHALDSEMFIRMVFVNKLQHYMLPKTCSYCHYTHDYSHINNYNRTDTEIDVKKVVLEECSQVKNWHTRNKYMRTNRQLPFGMDFSNSPMTLKQYYERNDEFWGFKDINFATYLCSF